MSDTLANNAAPATSSALDYHQYSVGSRLEISQILRAIMRSNGLITASVGGDDFFLTSIVSIDDESGHLMLECDREGRHAQRVLAKQRLLCNTTLDKIKIQFVCQQIEMALCEGRDAFKAALPQDLVRLQRRENYRVPTPIAAPVKCTLTLPPGAPQATASLSLVDISCGGMAVVTPQDLFTPELGTVYECTLHLPGTTALRVQVQARNACVSKLPNGKAAQRSGLAFINLRESMLSTIQRYIMGLERQRKK